MEFTPNLKNKYFNQIIPNLRGRYKSIMQVPRLEKICLNQGVGSASDDKKSIEYAQEEMTIITGQKALITKSTKDISNFKLRKGMPVGVMVTLRGNKMYEFLERFITSTLPRVRDFRGLEQSRGFDGRGNYTMGIKEQIAFPEISIDKINKITGMDITFVTNTNSDQDALSLLQEFGLPFKEDSTKKEERQAELEKQAQEERRDLEEAAKKEMSGEDNVNEEVSPELANDNVSSEDNLENEDNNNLSEESDKSKS